MLTGEYCVLRPLVLTPEKSELLQAFLRRLPSLAAVRLAKAVEVDRLSGGKMLPHDLILDALRPALPEHAGRTPSPLRLFCRPFEDLLVQTASKEKQKGRIARASLMSIWRWLSHTLIPEAVAVYCSEVKTLVLADRMDEARERANTFRSYVSHEIRHAIAKDRRAVRVALQHESIVADAEEIALLLTVGREIVEIQTLLPKRVPHLTEELLWALRDIHDRVAASVPDAAPYVACIAMNRLAHPWEALKLPQLVTHQTQDTLISSTDMGLVGDLLFADIEAHGNAVRSARHPDFDVDWLLENLAQFTEASSSIVKQIDMRRDGKWGKRLLKDRAAVAEVMEGFMERAPREVAAMLPVQKSGSFGGGPKVADFSKSVDDEKSERGLRYARLVAGCANYAVGGSFGAAHKEALDQICQHLRGYNEDVIREMRLADGERHHAVERQFELAAALTKLLFSPEEEDLLRRRARAAIADAA
jgi:hypothetical protein